MGKRLCAVNTACGSPRGEATWRFAMRESKVDKGFYPVFTAIDGESTFGAACCEACKAEIEHRMAEMGNKTSG